MNIDEITYTTPVSYIKRKGNILNFVTFSRSSADGSLFNVERGTKDSETGKLESKTSYDRDSRYVEFSIRLAVANNYKRSN